MKINCKDLTLNQIAAMCHKNELQCKNECPFYGMFGDMNAPTCIFRSLDFPEENIEFIVI